MKASRSCFSLWLSCFWITTNLFSTSVGKNLTFFLSFSKGEGTTSQTVEYISPFYIAASKIAAGVVEAQLNSSISLNWRFCNCGIDKDFSTLLSQTVTYRHSGTMDAFIGVSCSEIFGHALWFLGNSWNIPVVLSEYTSANFSTLAHPAVLTSINDWNQLSTVFTKLMQFYKFNNVSIITALDYTDRTEFYFIDDCKAHNIKTNVHNITGKFDNRLLQAVLKSAKIESRGRKGLK